MKPKVLAHNFTGKSLTLVYLDQHGKAQTKIADNTHLNWKYLEKAARAKDFLRMVKFIDVASTVNTLLRGKFTVAGGKVYRGKEEAHGYLFERIVQFLRDGGDWQRLLKFADNLYSNPDQKAHADLYKFLEHGNFPITKDGCFLAYKGVQNDYFSIHAGNIKLIQGRVENGKVYNAPGEVIEADRTQVDPDPNKTCSFGLHAGSYSYADGYKGSGKLVIVKVNPRDVVSIPADESSRKLRASKYKVIAEDGQPLNEADMDYEERAELKRHSVRGPDGKFSKA
jgi:hypothetical protein